MRESYSFFVRRKHQLHHIHQSCYYVFMKRATITFPDDLAEAVNRYRNSQETPPALTTVMQSALREYLQGRGFLWSYRPLKLGPVGRSGLSDVSQNHDAYFAGTKTGTKTGTKK